VLFHVVFAACIGVVRTAGYGLCDGGISMKIVVKQLYLGQKWSTNFTPAMMTGAEGDCPAS
jgi:hypothetical protein